MCITTFGTPSIHANRNEYYCYGLVFIKDKWNILMTFNLAKYEARRTVCSNRDQCFSQTSYLPPTPPSLSLTPCRLICIWILIWCRKGKYSSSCPNITWWNFGVFICANIHYRACCTSDKSEISKGHCFQVHTPRSISWINGLHYLFVIRR